MRCDRCAHRVFFRPQVTDDTNLKAVSCWPRLPANLGRRLIDDPGLGVKAPWQFRYPHRLENNQAGCHVERSLGFSIVSDVPIEIGSGQHDDQRQVRMHLVEAPNGIKAPSGVKRNHKIASLAIVALSYVEAVS